VITVDPLQELQIELKATCSWRLRVARQSHPKTSMLLDLKNSSAFDGDTNLSPAE
jgi:hypothetical protein